MGSVEDYREWFTVGKMASFKVFGNAARQFSTSTPSKQLVKPPIQLYSLEGRYASALYSAAHKQKALPQVEKDLLAFDAIMKKDAISSVLTESKASPLSINVLCAMAENGRLGMTHSMVSSFSSIMGAVRGEVECEVTTAKKLGAAEMKELETTLAAFLKKGQSLKLSTKVDPAIIGGMLVSIGDKFVDLSIASKINKYTELIKHRA